MCSRRHLVDQSHLEIKLVNKDLRINLCVGCSLFIRVGVLAEQLGQLAVVDSRSRRDTKLSKIS